MASFTKSMLIEKNVQDLVETSSRLLQQNVSKLWDYKEKKDQIAFETINTFLKNT